MPENTASLLLVLEKELEQHEQAIDLDTLAGVCAQHGVCGHLAVCTKLYLDKIVAGQKTIESRFSRVRTPPFKMIAAGEVVFLREMAGSVHAIALVATVQCFGPLGPDEAWHIMEQYSQGLQLADDFKVARRNSQYATLISFAAVLPIKPCATIKRDRRPWVVLADEREEKADPPSALQLHGPPDHHACDRGLHSYYNSKLFNDEGNPLCRYCGATTVDWKRLHAQDLQE